MDKSNVVNGAPAGQAHNTHTHTHTHTHTQESSSSMRRPDLATSSATSASASPFASRDSSPARPSARSYTSIKAAAAAAVSTSPASSQGRRSPSLTRQQLNQRQQAQAQHQQQSAVSSTPSVRSRRNSAQHDTSPTRTRTAIPTPTPMKPGALVSSNIPALHPVPSDTSTIRAPVPPKSDQLPQTGPRWPVSPRLRSPPPSLHRPSYPDAIALNLPRAPPSSSPETAAVASDSEADDLYLSGMRTPVRGASGNVPTLATVQEASPLAPSRAVDAVDAVGAVDAVDTVDTVDAASLASLLSETGASVMPEVAEVSSVKTLRARQLASQGNESGSDNAPPKKRASVSAATSTTSGPPPLTTRHSMAKMSTVGKGKAGESQPTTMTVETETVTSIPNVALGPSNAQGVNGSLRAKPSTETIRPKKDKKKTVRKPATMASGAGTSKADIFEAKVASAVDEANTSDSEETFVYDSNPADSRERPHRFHHSRTPSTTSLSQAERSGMRSIHSIMEGAGAGHAHLAHHGHGVTVKKSMKFVNTFSSNSGNDSGHGDDESSTVATLRGVAGSGRGTARLHHHVGSRFGLGKNGHASILDNESPFPVNTAARLKGSGSGSGSGGSSGGGGTGHALGPTSYPSGRSGAASPRLGGSISGLSGRSGPFSSRRGYGATGGHFGYDLDETLRTSGTGGTGEDERTPLVGGSSMRGMGPGGRNTLRGYSGRTRRHHMSQRQLESQSYDERPAASFLNRFASCLVLTVMLMLVISGAIGFMFATSQPLEDIELVKISNVIASEQELMFDLFVRAHNPNVVLVTVESADMEVFAKSPHAGTDSEWWRRPDEADVDVDVETETGLVPTAADQPDSAPNFLLGKFTEFDNPLSFEGSFFHHGLSTSRSGVRIRRPGNGTDHGSERWERILEDEFELIIKGVLRYSLPLSQRVRSALIEGRRTVKPNAVDPPVHNGTVSISA